jgi:hypothetical protein
MNDDTTPHRRSSRAWPPVILATALLCYLLWVMHGQTTPENWLARNGLVFIGISLVAETTAQLFSRKSLPRRCLRVVSWAALVVSLVGLYLRAH